MAQGLDIIGDVHGHAQALQSLLEKLGYKNRRGCFRHPQRRAIFVGDLIDRGTENFKTLALVRAMVERGTALVVMGNHEYNALCYHTRDASGNWLRPHSEKNFRQHREVLSEIRAGREGEWAEYLQWFKRMPLFLEIEGIRVVHACWDRASIDLIEKNKTRDKEGSLTKEFLVESSKQSSPWFEAVETLLKGKEIWLPEGHAGMLDKDGNLRRKVRLKWWLSAKARQQASTYDQVTRINGKSLQKLVNVSIPDGILKKIRNESSNEDENDTPVFFGHYWFTGQPQLLSKKAACLDYSIARGGKLAAYRWDGEKTLDSSKFCFV